MTGGHQRISVIVPSWQRRDALPQVLHALRAQTHPEFEVIVVADRPSWGALKLPPALRAAIRYLPATAANISRSRNLGIARAAGEIIAFCDDDAVPEPDWLERLTAPFDDPLVGAAGGAVRGPDGFSYQWQGARFDGAGEIVSTGIAPPGRAKHFAPEPGRQVGLMGVSAAYRRSALVAIGGFDESYRYYLDETDAVQRIADAGWHVAVVPDAELIHFQRPNAARGRLAKPLDLYEIGASKAHFCRRHGAEGDVAGTLRRFHADRRRRLDRYLRIGVMSPAERRAVMQSLERGLRDGALRTPFCPLGSGDEARNGARGRFRPFPTLPQAGAGRIALTAPLGGARSARRLARELAEQGHIVTAIEWSLGGSHPTVGFADGIWRHRIPVVTGLRGSGPIDLASEVHRIMPRRGIDTVIALTRADCRALSRSGGIAWSRLVTGCRIEMEKKRTSQILAGMPFNWHDLEDNDGLRHAVAEVS